MMRGSISNKKGQVQTLAPAIIALVFAAILLVFGLIITQSLRDTDVIDQAISHTVNNETNSSGMSTVENYTVSRSGINGANSFALVLIVNDTNSDLTSQFTIDGNGLIDTSASTINASHTPYNISYTYKSGGGAYISANKTLVGLGKFADFWEIIVLAIVITVVIGLLLLVFGGRRER